MRHLHCDEREEVFTRVGIGIRGKLAFFLPSKNDGVAVV